VMGFILFLFFLVIFPFFPVISFFPFVLSCFIVWSLPPPRDLRNCFFLLFLARAVASCREPFPSGGVFGGLTTMGEPVAVAGGISGVGRFVAADAEDVWMKFCGILTIWLHVLTARCHETQRRYCFWDNWTRRGGSSLAHAGVWTPSGGGDGLDVGVTGKQSRALHELRPMEPRPWRPSILSRCSQSVADRNDADEVRGITGEPGIVTGSVLAAGGAIGEGAHEPLQKAGHSFIAPSTATG